MIYFVDSMGVVTTKLPRIVDKSSRLSTTGLSGSKPSKAHYAQAGSTEFYDTIVKLVITGKVKLERGQSIQDLMKLPAMQKLVRKCQAQHVTKGNGRTRHKQSSVFTDVTKRQANRIHVMGEFSRERKFHNLKS